MDTTELKKKFLDILFETDESEAPKEKHKIESPRVLNAKDILYNKSQPSPFLDFEKPSDNKKTHTNNQILEEIERSKDSKKEYVFTPKVSPILGLLEDEDDDIVSNFSNYQTNNYSKSNDNYPKFNNGYVGTIVSPFYGYDTPSNYSKPINNEVSIKRKNNDIIEPSYSAPVSNKTDNFVYNSSNNQNGNVEVPISQPVNNNINSPIEDPSLYTDDPIPSFDDTFDDTRTEEIDLLDDLFGEIE